MIKITAALTVSFTLLIAIGCAIVFDLDTAKSAAIGGALMIVNLFGLWILWKLIFLKKSIALVVLIIIFKYLILGLILWKLSQLAWIRPQGFILGLSSLLFGIVGTTVYKKLTFRNQLN